MTDTGMSFGVRLPVNGPLATPSAVALVAQMAESAEYSFVSVNDSIAWSRLQHTTHISSGSVEAVEAGGDASPPTFFESLTTLAYAAGVTQRIGLVVSVLALPYRNPVVAAKQVATLDALSQGRLTLGVGVGAPKVTHSVNFEVLGISRANKYERTAEYLRAMQCIWHEEPSEYQGHFVSFPPTSMYPKPVQSPLPTWVGGSSARAMNIAAELGTGWMAAWVSPQLYPRKIAELRQHAERAGRGSVRFEIAATVHASISESRAEAIGRARRTVSAMRDGFADDATDEAVQGSGLVGSVSDVRDRVREYRLAGVTHLELRFIYRDLADLHEQLELFSAEIIRPDLVDRQT